MRSHDALRGPAPRRAARLHAAALLCLVAVLAAPASAGTPASKTRTSDHPPAPPTEHVRVVSPPVATVQNGRGTAVEMVVELRGTAGIPDVVFDGRGDFAGSPELLELGGGRWRVRMPTSTRLPTGMHRGMLTVRICSDRPCTLPVPGTVARRVAYAVKVQWSGVADWEMFQRDPAHTGHVPVAIDPAMIRAAWTFDAGLGIGVAPSGVTTAPGLALVAGRNGGQPTNGNTFSVYALHSRDGLPAWRVAHGMPLGPPTVSGDAVYLVEPNTPRLHAFALGNGFRRWQVDLPVLSAFTMAPTVANGIAYMDGAWPSAGVRAFDVTDGLLLWYAAGGESSGGAVAVADDAAFHYDINTLRVFDAVDGSARTSIVDAEAPYGSTSTMRSAPLVGPEGHVTVPAGVQSPTGRFLTQFSIKTGALRWRSVKRYFTQPALADGVLYAGAASPRTLDAIDAATGAVLWSWTPTNAQDNAFRNNVVVTRNLVFASTNRAVYALDRTTRQVVWSHPVAGTLSISGDGILYIMEGVDAQDGRIHAFRLF